VQHEAEGIVTRPGLRALLLTLLALAATGLVCAPAWAVETVTLTPTQDSFINQATATTNSGTFNLLTVYNKTSNVRNALVQFSLTTIPSDANIKTGVLALFMTAAPTSSRTYSAYAITQSWTEAGVTWNSRDGTFNWTTAGGTVNAATTSTTTGTTSNVTLSWTITTDVNSWFTGTLTNNGTLIKDPTTSGSGVITSFASRENATSANWPSLTVTYMRKIKSLTATAGNNQNILRWVLPGSNPSYTGTVIVRHTGSAPSVTLTDGTNYTTASAAFADGSIVVFSDNAGASAATTYTDSIASSNGTTYYYQAFARDGSNKYSLAGSVVNSTPTSGVSPSPAWAYATEASTLTAPGLDPGGQVITGGNDNKIHSFSPTNGTRNFAPFATGGTVQGRPPVLDAGYSTTGVDVAYVGSADGYLYAINTATGAQIWKSAVQLGDTVQGGASAWLQSIKAKTFTIAAGGTMTRDVVFVGTRNTNAGAAFNNILYALNGDTGTVVWSFNGTGLYSVNIISSTPLVDYANNAVWFTSQLGSNIGLTRQTIWKLDAATGALAGSPFNFGTTLGNIDSSPTLSFDGNPPTTGSSFLYTGNNSGQLLAVRLSDGTVFTHTPGSGTGAVKGFPLSFGTSTPSVATPDTIIFVRDSTLHAVSFNGATFSSLWGGPVTLTGTPTLSTPIDYFDPSVGASTVLYVGGSDGKIHEINITTGVDQKQRTITGTPTAGDPSLDYTNNRLYVGASDGNVYAFDVPF
jgi:outer membrane protein assembly factor BamB